MILHPKICQQGSGSDVTNNLNAEEEEEEDILKQKQKKKQKQKYEMYFINTLPFFC